MVSALTYQVDSDTLAEQIEKILESLSSLQFGRIPSKTVFQAILAIAGEEDIQRAADWGVLARRVQGRLGEAVTRTETALNRAITFLIDDVGVPLARLVPYTAQLVLITAFFGANPDPNKEQMHDLQRWFWLTSWSGYFAGANTTQIKNALLEMQEFASNCKFPRVDEPPRLFPDKFDMRSARVRALLLWQLRKFENPIDTEGQKIDVIRTLERVDTQAYRHVVSQGHPLASSPANRVVMPTQPRVSVKRAITSVEDGLCEQFCVSNGIPISALDALKQNDDEAFVRLRAEFLSLREQEFMRSWGTNPPSGNQWGETDIDTEIDAE
ncbi:MAG: hypothetical protein ACRDSR_11460 [Pseudonocardiaceae bacterium]